MLRDKDFWKYTTNFLAVVAVSMVFISVSVIWITEREDSDLATFKELQLAYQNDDFGGTTPDETISMLSGALENGDVDLAVKYFSLEKQSEMAKSLEIGKERDTLVGLSRILKNLKVKDRVTENIWLYSAMNDNNEIGLTVKLVLNKDSGYWKVESL